MNPSKNDAYFLYNQAGAQKALPPVIISDHTVEMPLVGAVLAHAERDRESGLHEG